MFLFSIILYCYQDLFWLTEKVRATVKTNLKNHGSGKIVGKKKEERK